MTEQRVPASAHTGPLQPVGEGRAPSAPCPIPVNDADTVHNYGRGAPDKEKEMDSDVMIANEYLRPLKKGKRGPRRLPGESSPFMLLNQVLMVVPVGKSKLYQMIADGEFPKPKKLGMRTSAWSRKEVDYWVADILGR